MIAILILAMSAVNAATVNVGTFRPSNWTFQPQIYVDLPSTIYAVEGTSLNIYFFNVIRFDGNWSYITNRVNCLKGSSDGAKWSYTPVSTDVGTNSMTISVCRISPFEVLFDKTVTLVTRPIHYPVTPATRNVLIIGDSTTAGGQVSAQLLNLFSSDSNYSVVESGPNTGMASDSGAVSRSVAMGGINGWYNQYFYTDTTHAWTTLGGSAKTGSPFVSGGVFDFSAWLSGSSTTMTAGDWVVFNLGINYIFSAASDSDLNTRSGIEIDALTNMIANIQSAVPGVKIGVALTIPPNQSTNAFDADYSGVQTLGRYRLNNHQFVENLLSTFGAGQFGVALIPINANIDTANNMANGVHPANAGYWQIADTYRAFLKGQE